MFPLLSGLFLPELHLGPAPQAQSHGDSVEHSERLARRQNRPNSAAIIPAINMFIISSFIMTISMMMTVVILALHY